MLYITPLQFCDSQKVKVARMVLSVFIGNLETLIQQEFSCSKGYTVPVEEFITSKCSALRPREQHKNCQAVAHALKYEAA